MLIHPTIERLQALHLGAMAHAFDQQRASTQHADLSFEDRLGLLVEAEWTAREQRRLTQRLRHAKLRYPASLEDVDFTTPRGLTRDVILSLGTGAWIREHHNLLITGPTGIGKSQSASLTRAALALGRATPPGAAQRTRATCPSFPTDCSE
jgi:DNA replication protein DnaC